MDGLIEVAVQQDAEILVTAIVGMIGILPTIEGIKAGKDIALANKETLVTAGGNVDIQNRKGERFNTELLYWNEATQKVYSDKFIRIQQPDRVITGHGLTPISK